MCALARAGESADLIILFTQKRVWTVAILNVSKDEYKSKFKIIPTLPTWVQVGIFSWYFLWDFRLFLADM